MMKRDEIMLTALRHAEQNEPLTFSEDDNENDRCFRILGDLISEVDAEVKQNRMHQAFHDLSLWFAKGNVGLSSKAIALEFMGVESNHLDYPRDVSELRRCVELIDMVPEAIYGLKNLAKKNRKWKNISDFWGELTFLVKSADYDEASIVFKSLTQTITVDEHMFAQNVLRKHKLYECFPEEED